MIRMRRQKSLNKPPPLAAAPKYPIDSEQLELELCWCVQQLEDALNTGELRSQKAEDAIKNIKLLKSQTTPLIRKRQIMKAALGDYRSKMKEEERELALAAKQIRFTVSTADNSKASFIKKSSLRSTEENLKSHFTENATETSIEASAADQARNDTDIKDEDAKKSCTNNSLNLSAGVAFKFNFNNDDLK